MSLILEKTLKRKATSTQSDTECPVQVKNQRISKETVIRTVNKEVKDCLNYYFDEGIISGTQYVEIQSKASINLIKRWILNKNKIQNTVKNLIIRKLAAERTRLLLIIDGQNKHIS